MNEIERPGRELDFLLRVTRRLPRTRGAVRFAVLARKFYLRRPRGVVVADVMGFKMKLDPADWVQGGLLFWPQLWDINEFKFLARHLHPGDTFLDVGAHVGFVALIASRLVGPQGTVVSVEAAPDLFRRLCEHLEMNQVRNVRAFNVAASDRHEIANLSPPETDNSAGRSVLTKDPGGEPVKCVPLKDLVHESGVTKISGAWLEIAGAEFKVLNRYFQDCDRSLWPGFMIVEQNLGWKPLAGGDVFALLRDVGYREEALQVLPSKELSNRAFVLPG
ncbi:MAG TPA: FkbM family methyltransferase [Candidatus Binataceae bacterium]|nr:FkbM family methyltransferase [Candidatus Binataceae bacterium]